jgi:Domain of unknown function (DUF5625)
MNEEDKINICGLVKETQLNTSSTSAFRLPALLAAIAILSLTGCAREQVLPGKPFAMDQANVKTELTFTITEEYKYDFQLSFKRPAADQKKLYALLDDNVDANGVKQDVPIDVSLEVFKVKAGKEQLQTRQDVQSFDLVSVDADYYNKQIHSEKLVPGNYRATLVLNKVTPELAGYKANFSIGETYLGK